MKLQKVLVVLGISTCLLAAEIQGTFGMEGDAPQEEDGLPEEDPEALQETLEAQPEPEEQESQPEAEVPPEPAASGSQPESAVQPERPENTAESEGGQEQPDTPAMDSGEQTEDSGNSTDVPIDDPEDEDQPDSGDISGEEDGAGKEDESEEEDGTGKEDESEEDGTGKEDESEEDGTGKEDESEEEDGADKEGSLAEGDSADKNSGAGSVIPGYQDAGEVLAPSGNTEGKPVVRPSGYSSPLGAFKPSSEFIDNREKVKYNVEMPIDGLPEFITAEMVVGALKCQDETGYPASVTIAQIIQESGFGKYGPEGDKGKGLSYLAYQYNNLFGIKGRGPAGTVDMGTGEQAQDGTMYQITAGFRVYHTYTECIEDRARLLDEVYSDLTYGVRDANTFAMKIGRRWATSLTYGQNLIQQMNRYDLYRLDKMTLDEFSGMLGTFIHPCPGSVLTSSFGYRTAPIAGASTYHKGVDLGTGEYHIPTYAVQEGTVVYAGEGGAEGNYIVISHENGLVTKYMHHDKIYVETGDEVEKGQQIGLSGSTGNSTGNHLHFQVEQDGEAVDPLLYLNIQ